MQGIPAITCSCGVVGWRQQEKDPPGTRWPFKGGTERMRGAGRSRAWWAAGGAADPAGGSGGFSFAEPGRRHRPVDCTFIGCCSPGIRAPAPAGAWSLAAAGGACGPALAPRAPSSAQPGRGSPSAASSDRSCCGWWRAASLPLSDLSLVPARRPRRSPTMAEPGAPCPALARLGPRRARCPRYPR